MDWEMLIPFFAALFAFLIVPGPGNLFCSAQSLVFGTRAGVRAALGLHLGGYVHVIAASLGLSILFETIPWLFFAMKLVGALLLVWMGLSLWRKGPSKGRPHPTSARTASFWRAFLTEAMNPTTAVFFVVFLPQFVSPDTSWPIAVQFLVLGTIVGLVFSISDLFYAVAAGRLHNVVSAGSLVQLWTRRLGGAVLIGLGVKIATSQNS